MGELRSVIAGVLNCSYYEAGPSDGPAVFLLHIPYAPQVYESVAAQLAKAGCRVITPYLRGYGPTHFLSEETLRSGEQAALGADLLALMDALEMNSDTLRLRLGRASSLRRLGALAATCHWARQWWGLQRSKHCDV